jgi:hypothetical protein
MDLTRFASRDRLLLCVETPTGMDVYDTLALTGMIDL